jgi:hypothetical protein
MAMSEPFSPLPFRSPEDIHGDDELQIGPVDGPDVLEQPGEPEPELDSVELKHDIPIRVPVVGERLTAEQLEAEMSDRADPESDA